MIHIAFEGIENKRKTTLGEALLKHLFDNGTRAKRTKELRASVGQILKSAFGKSVHLSGRVKTYLFATDRLERYGSQVRRDEKSENLNLVI